MKCVNCKKEYERVKKHYELKEGMTLFAVECKKCGYKTFYGIQTKKTNTLNKQIKDIRKEYKTKYNSFELHEGRVWKEYTSKLTPLMKELQEETKRKDERFKTLYPDGVQSIK